MASTFTAAAAASTVQPKTSGLSGNKKSVIGTYEITAALVVNDVIQMVRVPANATIVGVTLGTDDLDSGGSPAIVLDVGDAADTDRFVDGATVGQAGGVTSAMAMSGFGYQYSTEDTLDVLVQVAPATGATTGTITLVVDYVMP